MKIRCCGQIVGEESGNCKNREKGCICNKTRCKGYPLHHFKTMPKQVKKENK